MLYNNERKEWEHSGGSQGISRVHVYHHPINNTYRIVGRKVQDHAVCFQLVYGNSFFVTNYYLLECEFCLEFIFGFIHHRGGSRIFFRRGCTRLLLYFNTNKPHSFFFCRIPVVLENRRLSRGGGVHTPCTLPLDLPLHQDFLRIKNADNNLCNFCDVFGLVRVWMGCPVDTLF